MATKAAMAEATAEKLFNSAVGKMNAGDFTGADALVRQVLAAYPDNVFALQLHGVLLFKQGDADSGAAVLDKALSADPRNPSLLNDLGMVLNGARKHEDAIPRLQRAIALQPGFAGAHLNLANAYKALGNNGVAEGHYRKAIALNPQYAEAYRGLSQVLLTLMHAEAAVDAARKSLEISPRSALGLVRLGEALDRLGQFDAAKAAFEAAREIAPSDNRVRMAYARCLGGYGDFDVALAICRDVLADDPEHIAARVRLAVWGGREAVAGELEKMMALAEHPEVGEEDYIALQFALGRLFEEDGDYERAFACFANGNGARNRLLGYDPADENRRFADIKAAFTPDVFARFADAGTDDPTPIFVIGTPRSGTTLTEQILASHPEIEGAGELIFLQQVYGELVNQPGAEGPESALAKASPEMLKALGDKYVRQMRGFAPKARYIVDKMPANFALVGLIRLILPKARIVHTRRNPLDACLSMYKNSFATNSLPFSYDIGNLANYYRLYRNIMAHWETVLPGYVYHFDYEALTADLEGETRKMLNHLGLEWSDQCLRFFESKRPVHTASIAQVRKPVYQKSVGLADRYGQALDPLRSALAEWI